MLKHYSEFLKKNIWRYVVGVIILLLVDLFQLVLPQVLSRFTDSLLAGSTVMSDIHRIVIIIGILAVGIAVSRFLWRVMITWTAVYFEAWIRSKLFKHLTGLPRTFYHEHKTGDLMAHATNDIRTVRFASSGGIIMSVDALFI
ncbi:MAG: ABC transporter ATP-binding protein, partial [Tissierellia bacterium]|nr:ABC transporter ATP-binding protein [Tissierellia bacterium]